MLKNNDGTDMRKPSLASEKLSIEEQEQLNRRKVKKRQRAKLDEIDRQRQKQRKGNRRMLFAIVVAAFGIVGTAVAGIELLRSKKDGAVTVASNNSFGV